MNLHLSVIEKKYHVLWVFYVFNCIFFGCECVFFKTFIYICNEIIPPCSKMKLTNTSEYALRILTFMARNPEGLFSAKSLVEKLNISDKYLRRLMTDLTKAGFIYSIQGRDGGYRFAKMPNEIFLSEVIDAVEGMKKYTGCVLGFEKCSDENPCAMHNSWVSVRAEFVKMFTTKTISELDINDVSKF